jgi:hypothetical protein
MARARRCTDKEEKLETLLISTSQVGAGLMRAHLQKLTVCQLLLAICKLLFAICQEAVQLALHATEPAAAAAAAAKSYMQPSPASLPHSGLYGSLLVPFHFLQESCAVPLYKGTKLIRPLHLEYWQHSLGL